jgi:3'-phosphoadenosine 5'-phosphosulfate sulfotransferase (PAPS reductase)/FAD synthetase
MHIIFGNYGNNTIALLQWCCLQGLVDVHVININTGWSEKNWGQRVLCAQKLAKKYNFIPITLKPQADFSSLVIDRQQFPSTKFQWCAGFLKGLPLLAWADEVDPGCEAIILMGSRRQDSRLRADLPEFIEQSEHFGGRKVWYPLFDHSDQQRNELITAAGFEVLEHRSLECNPCIHDFSLLTDYSAQRCTQLEKLLKQSMLDGSKHLNLSGLEIFDMGCGSIYGCGE